VLGNDPVKIKLRDDIEKAWDLGKAYFESKPDITSSELFNYMCKVAKEHGWEFGGPHAGHLIGEFPHEKIQGEDIINYIHPDTRQADERPGSEREPARLDLGGSFC